MKPGYKTTEFWLTLLLVVNAFCGEAAHFLPPRAALIASSMGTATYIIMRGVQKIYHTMSVAPDAPAQDAPAPETAPPHDEPGS